MSMGIKVLVEGRRACFTRPEMKVERVSYDVMTPSAARGILEAICWKPAIRWVVDKIHVLNEPRFETVRRNEVGAVASARTAMTAMKAGSTEGLGLMVEQERQQRAATLLKDVAYVVEAHFEMTNRAGPDDNPGKFADMARRRIERGQCFHRPYLGCREFACDFGPIEGATPTSRNAGTRDLGWMLYDMDWRSGNAEPLFFRPQMVDGVIDVKAQRPEGAA
ncbi:MAG: type I-C CRISPR-associated protein Cas5c [Pseudomonadota bacterium]